MIDISKALAIDGWMAESELRWLAEAATHCRLIVEAGSYKGRSTRALADHCPGIVVAVDPWDGGYKNDDNSQAKWLDTKGAGAAFRANLADHIASGRVVPVPHTFSADLFSSDIFPYDALPQLFERAVVDLVFIDADHRYESVIEDIALAKRLVRPGGTIAGHDYSHVSWPGVRMAVDEMFGASIHLCRSIWWVPVSGERR